MKSTILKFARSVMSYVQLNTEYVYKESVSLVMDGKATIDLRTKVPGGWEYDYKHLTTHVKVLDPDAGSPTAGKWIDASDVIVSGVTSGGLLTLANMYEKQLTVSVRVTIPRLKEV